MKHLRNRIACILVMLSTLLIAQPSYYDLTFQVDSTTSPYAPSGTSYAYVRSKRGTSGVNPTSSADSLKTLGLPVTKIVLVFTETTPEAIADREDFNQERWENLIMTYPEFFQAKTTYKNVCQCSTSADGEEFKQAQGFYIYYKGATPAAVATNEKKAEEKPAPPPPPPAPSAPATPPKSEPAKKEAPATVKKTEPVKTEAPVEPPAVKNEPPAVKPEEPPAPKEEPKVADAPVKKPAVRDDEEEAPPVETKKKGGANKPRKTKDPKACAPACYGFGEEDLVSYFKDNITLTKKQKRKGKKLMSDIRIQLNVDGSIKKVMVTGPNPDFNKQVEEAMKGMSAWNPAVKGGTSVKSEVRMQLRYDKPSKSMKPQEIISNPKAGPKCHCVTSSDFRD